MVHELLIDRQRGGFAEIVIALRSGALGATELLQFCQSRVALHNGSLNALREFQFSLPSPDPVTSCPAKSGRLASIPFVCKDHIDVMGFTRSEGSAASLEPAKGSAAVVEFLQGEGALCVGKSCMAERGRAYRTETRSFGITRNPFSLEHTAGGSSGGDAAAVASGMALFAIGADSGGSVRVPASYCGLFGLSPTPGSISNAGLSSSAHTVRGLFRSLGPIALTLADIRILFSVLSRYDPNDPLSVPKNIGTETPTTKRLLVLEGLQSVPVEPSILDSVRSTAKLFEQRGWSITSATEFPLFERTFEPFVVLAGPSLLSLEDMEFETRGHASKPDEESVALQVLRQRIANELPALSSEMVLKAWYAVHTLRSEAAACFSQFDCILAPVSANEVPAIADTAITVCGQTLSPQHAYLFSSATNVLGLPALGFAKDLSSHKLPLGLQIIGPRFGEQRLFDALADIGLTSSLAGP